MSTRFVVRFGFRTHAALVCKNTCVAELGMSVPESSERREATLSLILVQCSIQHNTQESLLGRNSQTHRVAHYTNIHDACVTVCMRGSDRKDEMTGHLRLGSTVQACPSRLGQRESDVGKESGFSFHIKRSIAQHGMMVKLSTRMQGARTVRRDACICSPYICRTSSPLRLAAP